jgi:predicted dehydrogenase
MKPHDISPVSRRNFLKTSSTALAVVTAFPAVLRGAPDSRKLRIGLVGCGSRGTGAAHNVLAADRNVELAAVGDAFAHKFETSLGYLAKNNPGRVHIPPSRQFVGLDAFEKVIENCDLVLLATPPGFRPQHLRAAVEAGRHVFCEKPVATDTSGVRSVTETADLATRKGVMIKSGFNWRHDTAMKAFMERIHAGAVGTIRAIYATYYVGALQPFPAGVQRPPAMGDLEWQMRHWYNFVWLSGDGYVEQTVHACDWLMWMLRGVPPLKCMAVGGRQIPSAGGNIFDHIEVNYEWPGDLRGFIGARQQSGCAGDTSLYVMGAKGYGEFRRHGPRPEIRGENPWRFEGVKNLMHQAEQDDFFAAIRSGRYVNEGKAMADSTLCAIMGRMAAYTGELVSWDMALHSLERLVPEKPDWDMKLPVAPMARPGFTKFV